MAVTAIRAEFARPGDATTALPRTPVRGAEVALLDAFEQLLITAHVVLALAGALAVVMVLGAVVALLVLRVNNPVATLGSIVAVAC